MQLKQQAWFTICCGCGGAVRNSLPKRCSRCFPEYSTSTAAPNKNCCAILIKKKEQLPASMSMKCLHLRGATCHAAVRLKDFILYDNASITSGQHGDGTVALSYVLIDLWPGKNLCGTAVVANVILCKGSKSARTLDFLQYTVGIIVPSFSDFSTGFARCLSCNLLIIQALSLESVISKNYAQLYACKYGK